MSLTSILVHICICGVICTFYVNAGLTQFETLNTSSLLIGSLLLQMFFCVCVLKWLSCVKMSLWNVLWKGKGEEVCHLYHVFQIPLKRAMSLGSSSVYALWFLIAKCTPFLVIRSRYGRCWWLCFVKYHEVPRSSFELSEHVWKDSKKGCVLAVPF